MNKNCPKVPIKDRLSSRFTKRFESFHVKVAHNHIKPLTNMHQQSGVMQLRLNTAAHRAQNSSGVDFTGLRI